MAPSPRRTFLTIPTCLEGRVDAEVRIERVKAMETWGTADVGWKINWPTPESPVEVGSAVGRAPRVFARLPSTGTAGECPNASSPVLAAEFPATRGEHIGLDLVRIRYSVGGKEYQNDYEVTLGVCAKGVPAFEGRCAGS